MTNEEKVLEEADWIIGDASNFLEFTFEELDEMLMQSFKDIEEYLNYLKFRHEKEKVLFEQTS